MDEIKRDLDEMKSVEKEISDQLEKILAKDEAELNDDERNHIVEGTAELERLKFAIVIEEQAAEIAELKQHISDIQTGKVEVIGFTSVGNPPKSSPRATNPYERGRKYAKEVFEKHRRS